MLVGMTAPADPTEPASVASAIRAVVALPVVVGLVLPLAIIAVDPWRRPVEVPSLAIGAVMTVTGIAIVARTVLDFVGQGQGTLARFGPPGRLVTTGLFAHCRNPMYVGVLSVLAGLSMASRSPISGIYLLSAAAAFHLRVVRHEEPLAAETFPAEWPTYRRRVPRWVPRLTSRG